jgi:hypothetical protein
MKSTEILEWTMGWAWPVIMGIAVLIAWAVERIVNWNKGDLSGKKAGTGPDDHCVCN